MTSHGVWDANEAGQPCSNEEGEQECLAVPLT